MGVEIQYDLYFAAYLQDFNKNVLIPDFWCNTFDLAGSINGGLNRNKNHLIFVSPDLNKIPDFSLPVRRTLDLQTDGCYFGKILCAFNSKADAVAYVERRRVQLPPVYNTKRSEGRTTAQTKLLSATEYNNALDSGFTAMNNRFVLKTEKFCDEVAELRKRIVEYNNANVDCTDGLDDSDIEFLRDEIDESDSDIEFDAIAMPAPDIMKIEPTDENGDDTVDSSTDQLNNTGDKSENESLGNESLEHASENDNLAELNDSVTTTQHETQHQSGAQNEFHPLAGNLKIVVLETDDHFYPEFDAGLRGSIVKCLVGWNTTHPFNSEFYDKRFVGVLLKELFGSLYTSKEQNESNRIALIKKLFTIRVKNDENRLKQFDSIVEEKKAKAQNKMRAN